jgi:succinoglycan biosynthesis transport protein ExoP
MILSLEQFLITLRARWRRVLLTFAVVLAVALAACLAAPPRYEATASLALEMAGIDPIRGQAVVRPAGSVSTHIATQADILRSEAVALGAVRSLRLHEQPRLQEEWRAATDGRAPFEPWLAARLGRGLEVRPSRDSNVVSVSYTSPDPEHSAAAANAIVEAFIDTTLQMQVQPARQFAGFFAERAEPLRGALEEARARLSAYEEKHGVAIGEADVESARLAELSSQLVALQDAAAEAGTRRKQALANPAELREVRNDPEVAVLTGELARLDGHLAELKSEFGERHQAVIQARQSIGDTRRRLGAAMQRAAESLGAPARVVDARLAEVRGAIQRQRALVLERKSRRDAAAALLRDVDNAEKAYGAVLARASQTALEGASTTQTTVSVLKAASVPLRSRRLLILTAVAGALLGLLLGVARALLAERRDRRLRTIEDVTRVLARPLLLALPDDQAWRRATARSEQTRRRLVAPRPRLIAPQ